jgi:hypothetical protein
MGLGLFLRGLLFGRFFGRRFFGRRFFGRRFLGYFGCRFFSRFLLGLTESIRKIVRVLLRGTHAQNRHFKSSVL